MIASPPHVLVTGGAGYIGSHIVLALLEAGMKPAVLDNLSTGMRSQVPDGVLFFQGDCGDAAFAAETLRNFKPAAVVHCAGSIVVEESVKNPLMYYYNNTANSRTLIEACVKAGVPHFLFSSTASIYGNTETLPIPPTAPPQPVNPYATSKMMTELMLADTHRAHGLTYVALRYFNVVGADPKGRCGPAGKQPTHLIRSALHAALGFREKFEIYGTDWPTPDGTCIRDFVHVVDLAKAHVLALRHLMAGGESLIANCGYGHGTSVREVVRAVQEVTGENFTIIEAPRRAGDNRASVADAAWLREKLGWKPTCDDMKLIIGDALRWEQKLMERP